MDRPILFSGPMVRAILDGRKAQTRRVLKPQPFTAPLEAGERYVSDEEFKINYREGRSPKFYRKGDRLWVRETWTDLATQPQCDLCLAGLSGVAYRATDDDEMTIPPIWRPSIFMPRWASRLTLTVTDVRVQRLQDISEDDAVAEGIERMKSGRGFYDVTVSKGAVRAGIWHHRATESFRSLWDGLNAQRGYEWNANPWVCAITFTADQRNIDQLEAA